MKAIALISAILCLALAVSGQGLQTPVSKNGALQVAKGEIVNKAGQPPQLRGISFSWSIWEGRKYYNPQVVD